MIVTSASLVEFEREALMAQLDQADVFAFFYDAQTRPDAGPRGTPRVRDIKDYLEKNWRRSVPFIDIKDHFPEIYEIPPEAIGALNRWVIEQAGRARAMRVTSRAGTDLTIGLARAKQWTDVNGVSSPDLIPGEVATASPEIEGLPAVSLAAPAMGSDEDRLVKTQWVLVSIVEGTTASPPVEGTEITLEFPADGTAGGRTSCNVYGLGTRSRATCSR
jgi:hypothetical protein